MSSVSISAVHQMKQITSVIERAGADLSLRQCRGIEIDIKRNPAFVLTPKDHDSDGLAANQLSSPLGSWETVLLRLLSESKTLIQGLYLLRSTVRCVSLPALVVSFQKWSTQILDIAKQNINPAEAPTNEECMLHSFKTVNGDILVLCFTSLADVFSRLDGITDVEGVRRDASPLASRSAHVAVSVLAAGAFKSEDGNRMALSALQLLSSVLTVFPVSLRQQSAALEITLLSTVTSGGSQTTNAANAYSTGDIIAAVKLAAARCVALLPRIQSTVEAWSGMFRRTLISTADATDALFMGLDDPALVERSRHGLAGTTASHSISDPLLGSLPNITNGSLRSLRPAVDNLAVCLTVIEQLLTTSFPSPVPAPCGLLLSALQRLLRMDEGAILTSGRVPPSTSMFSELCSCMPAVRVTAWRLLGLMFNVGGGGAAGPQTPLLFSAGRLLLEPLRRIRAHGADALLAFSTLERQALYTSVSLVVRSGGIAAGRQMAAEAFLAAKVELYASPPFEGQVNATDQRHTFFAHQAWGQASKGHRKDIKQLSNPPGVPATRLCFKASSLSFGGSLEHMRVQCTALDMLAAVVKTSGAVLSASVRAQYDALAMHLACCAYDASVALTRDSNSSSLTTTALVEFQVRAFQLLLCTILSPVNHRPPFLSQAMTLFCKGRAGCTKEVAEVCSSALLAICGLMHPRTLPVSQVQQYSGLQDLQPLARPVMWSVVDASFILKELSAEEEQKGSLLMDPNQHPPEEAQGKKEGGIVSVKGESKSGGNQNGNEFRVTLPPLRPDRVEKLTDAPQTNTSTLHQMDTEAHCLISKSKSQSTRGLGKSSARGQKQGLTHQAEMRSACRVAEGGLLKRQRQMGTDKDGSFEHGLKFNAKAQEDDVMKMIEDKSRRTILATQAKESPRSLTATTDKADVSKFGDKAAVGIMDEESSDSEGSLPDIDSGDSDE
ncbi:hypothetical protein CEUSTIGMA_g3622.t1 [Chlamydomonas eustigma]|uniref:Pre-rRNA-processing protein RIX1 N-terminal domain-containing protein n=1 Tax=Chlamydomonas eustigma TaxID=1157962 RepID=A0A250WZB2_9CHLO|nr:hypothetical protein CEUSTIGMA_g3622.t1 [Chlamydomonas eustigma]|eukprot:GAX76178.1 hypothetical protein CEUSTIGMA_g3622.t1 [Chlamydomonas eustigma]